MIQRHFGTAAVLVLMLGLSLAVQPAQAQTVQIGYTNQQALLLNMPEYQDVQQTLQEEFQQRQQELAADRQELQEMVQQYQQQQGMLSEDARTQREEEIRQMQLELQQAALQGDRELRQRERELTQPLIEELQSAIEAVAQEQNLSLVVSSQALLYANDNVANITEDVAMRLDIEVDSTASSN